MNNIKLMKKNIKSEDWLMRKLDLLMNEIQRLTSYYAGDFKLSLTNKSRADKNANSQRKWELKSVKRIAFVRKMLDIATSGRVMSQMIGA